MTILVTNDDGHTKGLEILLEVAKKIDKDSYAIIPDRQRSAVSLSLTLHKPIRLKQIKDSMYTLSGTPADCVIFSIYSKKFPKPTLVLSGINSGDNCARTSILCSGTMGACWEALIGGIPAFAFSIYKSPKNWGDETPWREEDKIKEFSIKIIRLLKRKIKKDMFYNVTLPDKLANSKIVYPKKLQKKRFSAGIIERLDPNNTPYYWICGDFMKIEKGSDLYEVAIKNNVVVTPVHLSFSEK